MAWFFNNAKGKPDAMLTFAIFGFSGVMIKAILNGVTIGTVNCGTMDAALAAAILGSTLGAYVIRRGQDNKKEVSLASFKAE
jgi:hypothetical protein